MSASIKTLADGFNNEVYPKTKTAAVYDDNDNLLDTILSEKQNSTDSNLNTTAKTVVGAINEVDSDLGSPSSASAVTGNDAFSKISTLNSDLASVLKITDLQNSNQNANNLKYSAIYIVTASMCTNLPSMTANSPAYLITMSIAGTYGFQILSCPYYSGRLWYRTWQNAPDVVSWKEFTLP